MEALKIESFDLDTEVLLESHFNLECILGFFFWKISVTIMGD